MTSSIADFFNAIGAGTRKARLPRKPLQRDESMVVPHPKEEPTMDPCRIDVSAQRDGRESHGQAIIGLRHNGRRIATVVAKDLLAADVQIETVFLHG